jgi:hypothetical protein
MALPSRGRAKEWRPDMVDPHRRVLSPTEDGESHLMRLDYVLCATPRPNLGHQENHGAHQCFRRRRDRHPIPGFRASRPPRGAFFFLAVPVAITRIELFINSFFPRPIKCGIKQHRSPSAQAPSCARRTCDRSEANRGECGIRGNPVNPPTIRGPCTYPAGPRQPEAI